MTSTTSLVPAAEAQEPNLIKTDALGRMHRTPEQRERILEGFARRFGRRLHRTQSLAVNSGPTVCAKCKLGVRRSRPHLNKSEEG